VKENFDILTTIYIFQSALFYWIPTSLTANIRLGWKWLKFTNTLAYYSMAQTTTGNSFTAEASEPSNV
jgi:hypothetical protein